MLSRSEEDYIKVLYKLNKGDIVLFKDIAKELNIAVSSVTAMLKRLEKKEIVKYYKYKGAKLTKVGVDRALYLIRSHRIWEYFLVNELNLDQSIVHNEAEKLEHVCSSFVIEKLYEYLDKPMYCPHGNVIDVIDKNIVSLNELAIGDTAYFNIYFDNVGEFFTLLNLKIGEFFKVVEIYDDNSIAIKYNKNIVVIPSCFIEKIKVEVK